MSHHKHLTLQEREDIMLLRREGKGVTEIAEAMISAVESVLTQTQGVADAGNYTQGIQSGLTTAQAGLGSTAQALAGNILDKFLQIILH